MATTFLSTNLKRLREIKGFSAAVVAQALSITRSSYSGYENGSAEPKLELLVRLADYYSVGLGWLLKTDLTQLPKSTIETLQRKHQVNTRTQPTTHSP